MKYRTSDTKRGQPRDSIRTPNRGELSISRRSEVLSLLPKRVPKQPGYSNSMKPRNARVTRRTHHEAGSSGLQQGNGLARPTGSGPQGQIKYGEPRQKIMPYSGKGTEASGAALAGTSPPSITSSSPVTELSSSLEAIGASAISASESTASGPARRSLKPIARSVA